MKYEQIKADLQADDVLDALREQTLTKAALRLTSRGIDGWGDCEQSTWMMVDETPVSRSYQDNRFFEEEVIHWLRHALPLTRQKLDGLPDKIELMKKTGADVAEARKAKRHLTAFALVCAGLVQEDVDGMLSVTAGMRAAACFNSGDIREPEDRAAASLLDGIDVLEEMRQVKLLPLVDYQPEDEYGSWWRLQSTNLAQLRGKEA